jgi:hypothetical protein
MRARNMQALTDDVVRERPGATVWGKGDRAHQGSPSDHNEDDTAGSKPEQTDADGTPEHRAIDIPTLGPVTWSYLESLRRRLTERPANQRRLRYVILGQKIWRKRNGWREETYTGEYHGHLHVSGDVADDENGARWDLATVAPQPIQRRGIPMFLIHKAGSGGTTFALVGPEHVMTWKATDTITTPDGPISGQEFANAWARHVGDSKLETAVAFAALTMARGAAA